MTSSSIPRWLVGVVVAVAIPSIACFGYYTLEDLGETGHRWATLVILAYPTALVGLVWLVATCASVHRTGVRVAASALCFAIPASFLLLVRL
jgi:hypothetical protein